MKKLPASREFMTRCAECGPTLPEPENTVVRVQMGTKQRAAGVIPAAHLI
jgi:hypothetical protein